MRILQLSLRNYRVFEEVDLELPARVIGIFGPNGGGKSALVESILFALYGRARTDRKQIRTQGVLTDCAVRVGFEHGGQQYVVRRTIKGKGHQTEAEVLVGDLVLATGVQEVDAAIRGLLGMDQQVFRASVFAEQKQLDAFSDVTPGKRKDMVMRLLGIKPVEQALALARKGAKQTKSNAAQLAGSLGDTEPTERALKDARRSAEEAREEAETARRDLDEAAARAGRAAEGFERSDDLRQRWEKLEIELRGREGRLRDLEAQRDRLATRISSFREELGAADSLRREARSLEGASARLEAGRRAVEAAEDAQRLAARLEGIPAAEPATALRALEEARRDVEAAHRALATAEATLHAAEGSLSAAEEAEARAAEADPSQPCPTCGRPLGEDFPEYLAHCRREAEAARIRVTDAGRAVEGARARATGAERRMADTTRAGEEARAAADRRAALEERLAEAGARRDRLAQPFDGSVPDLEVLRADAARAREVEHLLTALEVERKHLARAEKDLREVERERTRVSAALAELRREAAGVAFDPEEHARLRKESQEANRLLGEARLAERRAADLEQAASGRVRELEAELRKVAEIAARVRTLREDARVLDRVAVLLDGFRDHLVARIGPDLSREAEVLFRELTAAEYDDLRIDDETLAIQIADGADYFSVERFSGSEADLANLALRVAISLHLSRMSGADLGMMVLDEVLGALDAERKDLFVRTMGRLSNHLHQLFVITHAEQVKDRFPVAIEVRKVGRRRSRALLV